MKEIISLYILLNFYNVDVEIKKALCLVLLLVIIIPIFQRDINTIPLTGDETHYWDIAFSVLNEGEYRFSDLNDQSVDDKYSLGFRRGEPLFPILIAGAMYFTLDDREREIILQECDTVTSCSYFQETALILSLFFLLMRISIFLFLLNRLLAKFNYPLSFIISASCLLMLPYEHKDLLTISLVLLSIVLYKKNNFIFYLVLGLTPLSNPSFLYILIPVLIYLFFHNLKILNTGKKILMLSLILIPSFGWMGRNVQMFDIFQISNRGPEVLAIRAEYSTLDKSTIYSGFLYYLPSKPFVLELIRGRYWEVVTVNNAEDAFDRGNEKSAYRKGKILTGNVGKELEKENIDITTTNPNRSRNIQKISIEIIRENWGNNIRLFFLFGFRGLFPNLDWEFRDAYEANMIGDVFSRISIEVFSLVRTVLIPLGLAISSREILNRKPTYSGVLLISTWLFFASLTHFIPRYSSYLVIPAVFVILEYTKKLKK